MTPKERAKDLVHKYTVHTHLRIAKESAIIAVDEIDRHIVRSTPKNDPYCNLQAHEYWEEVKSEINKL